MITNLHHIQLAMPHGVEDQARAFYGVILGLAEMPKPPQLAKHGGVWFEQGNVRVHLGVEHPFHPARKAHPAFEVVDLDALIRRLKASNIPMEQDNGLPKYNRIYTKDPFGNRLEFLQPN